MPVWPFLSYYKLFNTTWREQSCLIIEWTKWENFMWKKECFLTIRRFCGVICQRNLKTKPTLANLTNIVKLWVVFILMKSSKKPDFYTVRTKILCFVTNCFANWGSMFFDSSLQQKPGNRVIFLLFDTRFVLLMAICFLIQSFRATYYCTIRLFSTQCFLAPVQQFLTVLCKKWKMELISTTPIKDVRLWVPSFRMQGFKLLQL